MADQHDPPASGKGGLRRWWSMIGDRTGSADGASSGHLSPGRKQVGGGQELTVPIPDAAAHTALLMRIFASANQPEPMLDAFAQGMSTLHGELGDMGERLRAAYDARDWPSYARAMRQLIDKYIRTIDVAESLAEGRSEAEQMRDLLRYAIGTMVATLLQRSPELLDQAQALGRDLHGWRPGKELASFDGRLHELSHQIGLRANDADEQQQMLLGLFDLLLENVGELLDDSSWLQGQIGVVRQLISGPLDGKSIEQARGSLREVIYKQGLLKQGIVDSKNAMREMMVSFLERLDGMATSTGEYHARVSGYSKAIGSASSISELGRLLQDVLHDTAGVQAQALAARNSLLDAQAQVQAAEERITALERELKDVAGLVREDQLTGALNRRGFDEQFERETARTERSGQPLCVALLDLDDFRKLNETHGHAGGDVALCHLVEVARETLRASDVVARFGGEEFVLLMPDTSIFEANAAVTRLQRALAQRTVVHEEMRIFITFSAGVALRREGEPQDVLIKRADRAMYEAKKAGKNRVVDAG